MSARQWFEAVDTDRSGHLDVFELQRALAMGRISFSQKTVQSLMRLYDRTGNGRIGLQEYEQMHVFLSNVSDTFRRYDRDRDGELRREEVQVALGTAGYRLEAPAFAKLYESFDPDRSGTMNLTEFLGMTIFVQSLSAAFAAFDPQRTGKITLTFDQAVYFCSSVF